jgi:hypothetical protein
LFHCQLGQNQRNSGETVAAVYDRWQRIESHRRRRRSFHKLDETIRGHVFCSFLALVLKTALKDRIAALARPGSRAEIIADLDSLTETEIQ